MTRPALLPEQCRTTLAGRPAGVHVGVSGSPGHDHTRTGPVALSADAAARLRALAGDGALAPDLPATLQDLLDLVLVVVPSCLGVSLTVHRHGRPVTLVALAGRGPAVTSLTLRLPATGRPGAEPGPVLVVWAGLAGTLAATRRDWLALLELDPARAVLDADLVLPPHDAQHLGGALAEAAVLDQALGMLLEQRGLLQEQGRAWLLTQAAESGGSVLDAARAVCADRRAEPG